MIEYDDEGDVAPAQLGKPSTPTLFAAPDRNALIERLTNLTFKHWTDGPKIVFDCYGVLSEVLSDSPKAVNVITGNLNVDAVTQLITELGSIPTFYYVGRIEDYQTLRERFPKRELIYLVL